jgi:hypothetical protein
MLCEICGSKYRKIDSNLICQNGHTLQNAIAVADDDFGVKGKSRKIRKEKVHQKKIDMNSNIGRLCIMRLIYNDAKKYFSFSSDKIFKLYTNLYKITDADIESSYEPSLMVLGALVYLSVRSEKEKQGNILLFSDFRKKWLKFNCYKRARDTANLLKIEFNMFPPNKGSITYFSISTIEIIIRKIADFNRVASKVDAKCSETGVYFEYIERTKANIRSCFSADYDLLLKYKTAVLKDLNIVSDDRMLYYFKKFTFVFAYNRMFIAELDICYFLILYFLDIMGNRKGNMYKIKYQEENEYLRKTSGPETISNGNITLKRPRDELKTEAKEFIFNEEEDCLQYAAYLNENKYLEDSLELNSEIDEYILNSCEKEEDSEDIFNNSEDRNTKSQNKRNESIQPDNNKKANHRVENAADQANYKNEQTECLKKGRKCIYKNTSGFQDSHIEKRILAYLNNTQSSVGAIISKYAYYLDTVSSPEGAWKISQLMSARRFGNLRKATWLIESLKKNK